MKNYDVNETLLGDGVGIANFVYFILSGRCQMIESLQVVVKTHLGRSYYSLYDPYVQREESEEDFDAKYFGAYKNLNQESRASAIASSSIVEEEQKPTSTVARPTDTSRGDVTGSLTHSNLQSALRKRSTNIGISKHGSVHITESKKLTSEEQARQSVASGGSNRSESRRQSSAGSQSSQQDTKLFLEATEDQTHRESHRFSTIPEGPMVPENLRTYFMQVCQLNPGSSFGFGENMRDRRIVALTPVSCMLMPKIWLLQRNTANIWSRIQHYLEKKIPTKQQLFKEFVSHRRWLDYRDLLVNDVVDRSNTVNYTSVHDVPYSIRMNEMLDI